MRKRNVHEEGTIDQLEFRSGHVEFVEVPMNVEKAVHDTLAGADDYHDSIR